MAEAIYLYHCTNEFLLNHTIEDKIKEFNVDPFNIIKYDLLENPSDDILEDLQTVSFFAETKVIVIRNIEELEKEDEYVINSWISYFEKPNPDVILIIAVAQLLPDTSVLGAALFKYAFIEKVKDMDKKDYPDFIKNMFKKYQYSITDDAVDALLERTNLDFNLINQEAEKLMLFAYDTKEITEKAVVLLVSRNLEENIFELTNALLSKNQTKTIEIFYDLVARNEDPLRILNNIVGKVRELMHTKLLIDKGYRQDQIAEHFHIKSGRAYYLVKNATSVNFQALENHLKKLSKLDYDIKSGKIDKKLGLELYLLGA
ncbi:DNA polymerase III subunit delta [Peloplasma aerotolerans]|jgi:DNA polymerase III subunit delta|uniref:DNA polymerase III subunit delta n=1 Tax=Peloplasma aerotolerans TaxID=3044389 RepID=A0AAW6U8M6_9MOLU|nr:DNA polymerase III subunit delta [Mariniplasma sp. M4Ah]MDI6452314.1 DNA polymerase III subunit delta [Mariniplasma sp. M4Ah]